MYIETIGDIIVEIRAKARWARNIYIDEQYPVVKKTEVYELLNRFADNLEKAYVRQIMNGSMCTMSCASDGKLLEEYVQREKWLLKQLNLMRRSSRRMKETSVQINQQKEV